MTVKTNDFYSPDELMRIPNSALIDILTNGYAYIHIPGGNIIKITKDDLLFKEEEVESYIKKLKSKCKE